MSTMQDYLSKFLNTAVSLVTVSNNRIQGDLLEVGEDYLLIDQAITPLESRTVVIPNHVIESIQLAATSKRIGTPPVPERATQERPAVAEVETPKPVATTPRRR